MNDQKGNTDKITYIYITYIRFSVFHWKDGQLTASKVRSYCQILMERLRYASIYNRSSFWFLCKPQTNYIICSLNKDSLNMHLNIIRSNEKLHIHRSTTQYLHVRKSISKDLKLDIIRSRWIT